MEGKAGFIILIAIVAFLSLTLALLTGYVFFTGGHQPQVAATAVQESTAGSTKPTDEELVKEKLFEEKKFFNLKPGENGKAGLLQLNAELVYFKEVPGIKLPSAKITASKTEIKELFSTFFLNVTLSEVSTPEGRDKIKAELVNKINEMLKENEKSKNDIIYNIVLEDVFYQ